MTHSTARDRHQLERIWQVPTTDQRTYQPADQPTDELTGARADTSSLSQRIAQIGKEVLAFFTGQQQLRIWTKSTKQGVVWFAYDPMTEQRISHCSEAALRIWLESRHHH